ncbi:MAG: DEAD/DEAH box helicase, partial [Coriobacteriales bacterium]|nr:DEAD/DEAH box helicase [Coriobacteriales bacterium]
PGRLLDLHGRGVIDLSNVDTLVLDEADRMLDMGFWPDVRRILSLLPDRRQNLLFSATMAPEVIKIVESVLDDPIRVEVSPPATPVERIAQSVMPVCRTQKTDLLVHLLKRGEHSRMLVFTRTKHRADRLARQLSRAGVASSAIHGGRTQPQRQKALKAFKDGTHPVLVATDVVARGIDVDDVSHVINYDMPNTAEDYVHRIGRTARAGASGTALSFLSAEEHEVLTDIEKTLGSVLACEDLEGFTYVAREVPDPGRQAGKAARQDRGASPPARRRSGRRGGRGRASRGQGGGGANGAS